MPLRDKSSDTPPDAHHAQTGHQDAAERIRQRLIEYDTLVVQNEVRVLADFALTTLAHQMTLAGYEPTKADRIIIGTKGPLGSFATNNMIVTFCVLEDISRVRICLPFAFSTLRGVPTQEQEILNNLTADLYQAVTYLIRNSIGMPAGAQLQDMMPKDPVDEMRRGDMPRDRRHSVDEARRRVYGRDGIPEDQRPRYVPPREIRELLAQEGISIAHPVSSAQCALESTVARLIWRLVEEDYLFLDEHIKKPPLPKNIEFTLMPDAHGFDLTGEDAYREFDKATNAVEAAILDRVRQWLASGECARDDVPRVINDFIQLLTRVNLERRDLTWDEVDLLLSYRKGLRLLHYITNKHSSPLDLWSMLDTLKERLGDLHANPELIALVANYHKACINPESRRVRKKLARQLRTAFTTACDNAMHSINRTSSLLQLMQEISLLKNPSAIAALTAHINAARLLEHPDNIQQSL